MECDDATLMALAAVGNGEAFALMRDALIASANEPSALIPAEELMLQAEVFARLAAELSPMDKLALAAILCMRSKDQTMLGNEPRSAAFLKEVYGIFDEVLIAGDHCAAATLVRSLSLMADGGDDTALIVLERLIAVLSPQRAAAVASEARRQDHEERA